MKKPSEMTGKEGFDFAKNMAIAIAIYQVGPHGQTVAELRKIAFPSDPVERVSDDAIVAIETFGTPTPEHAKLMALELIERRKADRDPSVVGQHGEKR